MEEAIAAKAEVLEAEALKQRLASEKVDITLPGRKPQCGHLHPITLTMREIEKEFLCAWALKFWKGRRLKAITITLKR